MRIGRRARVAAVLAGTLVAATPQAGTAQRTAAPLPARLEQYLKSAVGLSASERNRLIAGEPVTKLLDADASQEVAIFGAIWIDAPIHRYVEAVKDIESFERGGAFRITRRISSPPRLDDFDQLSLPAEVVRELRTCRVGDCIMKLGEQAMRRFRTEIDWNGPNPQREVNALMRQLALDYVTGYLEGGNARLAVYRDNERPTFVAQELRSMIEQMPELTTYMPDLRRYLLEYPAVTLAGATSFLYWQETEFGLRPTIRISHLTISEGPQETVVASKMLYASHYFWTGLELRVLLPDPARGRGFWFVTVNRSRSDGLSGFTGFFVRRRVRGAVQDGTRTALMATRQKLEQPR